MDNSMNHHARKKVDELKRNTIRRVSHPAYSPDLSPWDFWLFGLLKEKLKEHRLSTAEQIIEMISAIGDSTTFTELQSVFAEYIQRLTWLTTKRMNIKLND
jgi:hypothetical protein